MIVGGTGLYIDSLLAGVDFAAQGDGALREELNREYDETGGESMLKRLRAVDPVSADRLHPSDRRRIVRALEIHALTGETKSALDERSRTRPPRYDAVKLVLSFADRADLYPGSTACGRDDGPRPAGRGETPAGHGHFGKAHSHAGHRLQGAYGRPAASAPFRRRWRREARLRRYAKRQLSWLRRDGRQSGFSGIKSRYYRRSPIFDKFL